jgi:acetyltransferase-like isoleucine patch superfamily enzyme
MTWLRKIIPHRLGFSGGRVSWKTKIDGLSKNIHVGVGAYVLERAWLECFGEKSFIEIGERTLINPYVKLHAKGGFIKIGKNSGVHSFCVFYGTGGITIGDDCRIASNTTITASNHGFDDPTKKIIDQPSTALGIHIEDDVWIGAGVRILDGVKIGAHSVIGAGSVVTKSVPPNSIVIGVPARVIRKRGEKI